MAASNVLGTERITNIADGSMVSGPKGRIFGFVPYSTAIKLFGNLVKLRTFPVELRDGAIWLKG